MFSVVPVTGPSAEPMHLDEAKLHLRETSDAQDTLISDLVATARNFAETWRADVCVCSTFDLKMRDFPDGDEFYLPRLPAHSVSSITYVDANGDSQTLATSVYTFDGGAVKPRVALAYNQSWPTVRDQINAVTVRFTAGWLTPFTANPSTDYLTLSGRSMADGSIVRLSVSGGNDRSAPGGLAALTDYYVVNASGSTVQLSASSGGAAVNVTDTGTGTQFVGELPANIRAAMLLLIGHWNENREATAEKPPGQVGFAVESLLDMNRAYWL